MKEATPQQLENWNSLILKNPDGGEVLQTKEWGEFKGRHGWKPRFFVYKFDHVQIAAMFLTRHVKGLGELWYGPKGPGVLTVKQFIQLSEMTDEALHGQPGGPFLVKFEPEIIEDEPALSALNSPLVHMQKPVGDVHISRATVRISLKPGLDEILASFKPKTRYNIRLAEKKGIKVEPVATTPKNLGIMYDLMRQTQKRAGFVLRPQAYFEDYWQTQAETGQGQLFFAKYQGKVLAGAFITFLDGKGWYKDGGSTNQHRELMPTYLLQWEIMRWLKLKGVKVYDLVGVSRAGREDMKGLDQFKEGFGGQRVEFIGTWDLPIDETKYNLWTKAGERVLLNYYNRVKKSLWY